MTAKNEFYKLLTKDSSGSVNTDWARILIAIVVIGLSVLGTIGLGVIAIVFLFKMDDGTDNDKDKQIHLLQFIFTALLPLWGTWIGTVIAYYFSKENFLAANQTVQNLVDQINPTQKLKSIKSKDVMIPFEKIALYPITKSENLKQEGAKQQNAASTVDLDSDILEVTATTINLVVILNIIVTEALDFMKNNKVTRLPLFTERRLELIIHQSAFEQFITEQTLKDRAFDATKATISDMKNKGSDRIKGFLNNGAQFVNAESNLRDAQLLIENNPSCQDVFVTLTGKASEPVIGWITNSIIAENIKLS